MKEVRYFQLDEVRGADDAARKIEGYAAVFDKSTEIKSMFGSFFEKIERGAFSRSLKQTDVAALWNHNTDIVIGETSNGSLTLTEDEKGLRFSLNLPDTTAGVDAYKLIKGGFVRGMSFGFEVLKHEWSKGKNENDPPTRTLRDVELYEISPTRFPAYPQTTVKARSTDEVWKEYEAICKEQVESTVPELSTSTWKQKLERQLDPLKTLRLKFGA